MQLENLVNMEYSNSCRIRNKLYNLFVKYRDTNYPDSGYCKMIVNTYYEVTKNIEVLRELKEVLDYGRSIETS